MLNETTMRWNQELERKEELKMNILIVRLKLSLECNVRRITQGEENPNKRKLKINYFVVV